jgi:hypothetical protein
MVCVPLQNYFFSSGTLQVSNAAVTGERIKTLGDFEGIDKIIIALY